MSDTPDDTHRILNQADALMNRHRGHRTFVARNTAEESQSAPTVDAVPPADEDFPVLTEVVNEFASEFAIESGNEISGIAAEKQKADLLAAQRQQIEEHLERWLDNRLPDEVLRVMDGVSDQLIGSLVTRMREELLPELLTVVANNDNEDQKPTD